MANPLLSTYCEMGSLQGTERIEMNATWSLLSSTCMKLLCKQIVVEVDTRSGVQWELVALSARWRAAVWITGERANWKERVCKEALHRLGRAVESKWNNMGEGPGIETFRNISSHFIAFETKIKRLLANLQGLSRYCPFVRGVTGNSWRFFLRKWHKVYVLERAVWLGWSSKQEDL